MLGIIAAIKIFTERIIHIQNPATNHKHKHRCLSNKTPNLGKNPTNEISLTIGQNPDQSDQVSLHRSPPGLHYNEVFPALL